MPFICIITTLWVASATFAEEPFSKLAREFSQLRNQQDLIKEIDGQRLIEPATWEASFDDTQMPWLKYGEDTFNNWLKAAQWIQRNADDLPFDLELYDRLEKIVLRDHYYSGFEIRRIQAAMAANTLSKKGGEALLARIRRGEKINFSRVDHSTLPGQFRFDPLDEFQHNGDLFLKDGSRYLVLQELENARNNPLLKVLEETLVRIGKGKYKGTIEYPRIVDLRGLVQKSFETINRKLKEEKDLESKVRDILNFRTELMTIHRSLDGNGRTIRLLADLLFLRLGLPPPLFSVENDIFGNSEEVFELTLKGMQAYLQFLRYRLYTPKFSPVLFHWSTKGSFDWMKAHMNSDQVPMQTIDKNSVLAVRFPNLADKMGTHVWTNPLKGLYGGRFENGKVEWYVKPNRIPVLIAYFIEPDAKIVTLRTVAGVETKSEEKFENVDIIYHQHLDKIGNLIFHEKIILNPKVVRQWTSNVEELAPYIEQEKRRITQLKDKYPEFDNHYIGNETRYTRDQSYTLIQKFLDSKPQNLFCEKIFGN